MSLMNGINEKQKRTEVSAMKRDFSLACVFWDRTLNNNKGDWSYKGCISNIIGSTLVQCFCDHLTSFAVILELKPGSEIHKVHADILSTITYIGCSLSIFGLGMIILTFILFRKWRKDSKHKMLFHLSLALICFLLLFIFGIMKKEPKYGCITIAVFLHYFMLASFAWMLVEAFMQYLSLVKVIGTYIPGLMQKAMLFGWGTPLLIVGITLGVNHHLYDSGGKYCWLADDVFYFAVAGPVLAMLVLNFVIFGLILYSNTCGRQTKYLRTNQNERQETVARAKAIFCVSVLLGLSWIFGFLAIDGAKLIFQYLFAITTTLQGFFIFVFFVDILIFSGTILLAKTFNMRSLVSHSVHLISRYSLPKPPCYWSFCPCAGRVYLNRDYFRISAANKEWQVYPLDPRPDAVVLYSGCIPGKHCAWFLPDDRYTASLVKLRGGWKHARTKLCFAVMDPMLLCPGKGLVLPSFNIDKVSMTARFLLISLPNNEMSKKSPFAVHKALAGICREPKSIKPLCSGDLLIEMNSAFQTKSFLLAKSFLDCPVSIVPHKSLNFCRGVISEPDLLCTSEAEILEEFSDHGVTQVRRIIIKKEAAIIFLPNTSF
ncbi:adhesion G-protein coupled receptor G4 [Trichonephila clavipes]|uniref:Adhesion G-protein coupled receptor G4 n=1 Tax=Trichonephila clavipes TaxID=2585209 RepID=A0A8X7BKV2_TRICX|nr:adhesion G-protein coupled receptor G4 [Trichonephila clavipes]